MNQVRIPLGGIIALSLALITTYFDLWQRLGFWGSFMLGLGLVVMFFRSAWSITQ